MNRMGWVYFALALLSAGFATYLGNGVLVQLSSDRPMSFVMPAILAGTILVLAALLLGWLAFLYLFRFVAEIRKRDDRHVLIASDGQEITTVDNIKTLKTLRDPSDQAAPISSSLSIFSAGGRLWVGSVPRREDA